MEYANIVTGSEALTVNAFDKALPQVSPIETYLYMVPQLVIKQFSVLLII